MLKGVLLPAVLVALWCAPAVAQETTATVTGTVSDQTGAVLPGVAVVARHAATGATKTVATTDSGRYSVPFLPVGEYEISYSLPGFQPHVARGVSVHVNDRITINARLNVRGEQTSVEVSTASALVQATPAVQWLMRPVQVQALPLNNRNFVQLATLVPGRRLLPARRSRRRPDEQRLDLDRTGPGATPSTGWSTARRTSTSARTSRCSRRRRSSRSRSSRS